MKKRLKIGISSAIVIALILFILGPAGNDTRAFFKNSGYLTLKSKYASLLKASSDKTSVLAVRPLYFLPLTKGQRKARIVAELKIRNRRSANNIRLNFRMQDGLKDRSVSKSWNAITKQSGSIFSMLYPDTRFVSWTPDIPDNIKNIAQNKENPLKLWLIISWRDTDKRKHKIESYSELRYDEKSDLYYFDEIRNGILF